MSNTLDFSLLEEKIDPILTIKTLETQLAELEMLQSMYSNPGELNIDDSNTVQELKNFVQKNSFQYPPQLGFSINVKFDDIQYSIIVDLPMEYPDIQPDVFVRSDSFKRDQQKMLNLDLNKFIDNLERGDMCVSLIINWVQENGATYLSKSIETKVKKPARKLGNKKMKFQRLWIYSHHLYSKVKRKALLELSLDANVTGFSLPGRPGIICIEGIAEDCDDVWSKIRVMGWKKIMICEKEEHTVLPEDIPSLCKFKDFTEKSFEGSKIKGRDFHMDFGCFYKFLVDINCEFVFKSFFGMDGKVTSQ